MSDRFKFVSVIVIGILLAIILIAGITLFQREFLVSTFTSRTSSPTSTTTSSSTSISGQVSSTSQLSTVTSQQAGFGSLILRIHDPPKVPLGVSAIYVTYSAIFLGQSTGKTWVDLKQNGSINLMSVVNFTQTIANVKISSGTFNLLVMNISSAIVTSYSVNYSASVPSDQLSIPFSGSGVTISNSTITGAVIDVSPTVIQHNIYNSTGASTISFVLIPSANAYLIPAGQLGQNATRVGEREDYSSEQWLTRLVGTQQNQTSYKISAVILSNSSFIMVLKNTGNSSVTIQNVFIESNGSASSGEDDLNIGRSVIFVVLSNGSVIPNISGEFEGQSNTGYNLASNSQVALSYFGPIPPSPPSSSTSSQSSDSGSEDDAVRSQGMIVLDAATISYSSFDQNNYGFQIVPGQDYLVGASSGSVTTTFLATAS
jgi:hypothetical protein